MMPYVALGGLLAALLAALLAWGQKQRADGLEERLQTHKATIDRLTEANTGQQDVQARLEAAVADCVRGRQVQAAQNEAALNAARREQEQASAQAAAWMHRYREARRSPECSAVLGMELCEAVMDY